MDNRDPMHIGEASLHVSWCIEHEFADGAQQLARLGDFVWRLVDDLQQMPEPRPVALQSLNARQRQGVNGEEGVTRPVDRDDGGGRRDGRQVEE
jgi:hypothetical protein